MRRDEEIIDACIALGLFLLLCVFYCCVTYFDKVESLFQRFVSCHVSFLHLYSYKKWETWHCSYQLSQYFNFGFSISQFPCRACCHYCCPYCCCSNCCQGSNDLDNIPQYSSLEEFLWDATEDSPMGRIVTANDVQEIEGDEDKCQTPLDLSQCFLPVLRQKFQTNHRRSRQPEENTLLSEPLL
jgi:hypothetical protein